MRPGRRAADFAKLIDHRLERDPVWMPGKARRQAPMPARFAREQLGNGPALIPAGTGRLRTAAILMGEYEERYCLGRQRRTSLFDTRGQ